MTEFISNFKEFQVKTMEKCFFYITLESLILKGNKQKRDQSPIFTLVFHKLENKKRQTIKKQSILF